MAKTTHDYQPQTFEQRGVHVPFRHKYLASVRLRTAKGPEPRDWDAVIQNFSENRRGQNLVMGWRELPKFTSLEAFDQALYERVTELGQQHRIDPLAVRIAHLETVCTCAEGDMERVAAGALLDRDRAERSSTEVRLLTRLVHECAIKAGFAAPPESELLGQMTSLVDSDGRVRAPAGAHPLLDQVVSDLRAAAGITRDTLITRIEATAEALAPLGGITADPVDWSEGYLLKSYCRLREFRGHISEVAKEGGPYYFNAAVIVLFGVVESIKYIDRRLAKVRLKLKDIDAFLLGQKEWEEYFLKIRRDIAYALDGWATLVGLWEHTVGDLDAESGFLVIRDTLARILHWLPAIPSQEIEGGGTERLIWDKYDSLRTSAVQEMTAGFEEAANAAEEAAP